MMCTCELNALHARAMRLSMPTLLVHNLLHETPVGPARKQGKQEAFGRSLLDTLSK